MTEFLKAVGSVVLFAVLATLTFAMLSPRVQAAPTIQGTVYIINTGTSTLETISCNSGASPCTIGAAATAVLGTNTNRHECLIQNVGTTAFTCLRGAGTVSTSNQHFTLKAGSAANDGTGGSYSCNQGSVVWTGAVSCISSGSGGSLAVSAD